MKTKEVTRSYKDLEEWGDTLGENPLGEVDPEELQNELLRVGYNIDEEISSQAGYYGWWSVREAQAVAELDSFKYALDIYRAERGKEIREEFRTRGDKLTEGYLEDLLVSEEEHQRLQKKIISAKRSLGTIAAVRKALEHRLQMIITICANRRKEQQGDFNNG